MGIWQSVNARLPLLSSIHLINQKKDKRFAAVGKDINRKHNKAAAKRNFADKLDSLFDIDGALVLWKCYRVMTEELTVMLITANKSTFFALAPQLLKFRWKIGHT